MSGTIPSMKSALGVAILPCVVACATADKIDLKGGNKNPDAGQIVHADSSLPQLDAFILADAPPGVMTKTLSQTTNDTLAGGNSVACPAANGDPGTSENHFYRVFDLSTFGISTAFTVTGVSFQVEDCESVAGNGTTVNVHVGTYSGATGGSTLTAANLTEVSSATGVAVPEVDETGTTTPGATINVPMAATIPAGSKLYVEIESPDGDNDHQFYIGTTTGGQSAPSYVSAGGVTTPVCSPPGKTPTDPDTLVTNGNVAFLLTVTGQY